MTSFSLVFYLVLDLVAVFESGKIRPVEYNITESHNDSDRSPTHTRQVVTAPRYLLLGSFPFYFSLIFTVKQQLVDNGFALDFKSELGNKTVLLLSVVTRNRTLSLASNTGHLGSLHITRQAGQWVKFGVSLKDGFIAVIQGCKEDLKLPFPRDLTPWKRRGRIEFTVLDELDSTKRNVRAMGVSHAGWEVGRFTCRS